MLTSDTRDGQHAQGGVHDQDWNWPDYDFLIPAEWPSGVYIAMLCEVKSDGSITKPDESTSFGTSAKILFVVKSVNPKSTILYNVPLATYHAYNLTGGGSFYSGKYTKKVTSIVA